MFDNIWKILFIFSENLWIILKNLKETLEILETF